MPQNNTKVSRIREDFNSKYDGLKDSDLLKEILFTQEKSFRKLEKIRSNTSMLITWLVIIPIISWIIYAGTIGAFS